MTSCKKQKRFINPRLNVIHVLVRIKNLFQNMVHTHQNSPFLLSRCCLRSSTLTLFHKHDLKECKTYIRIMDHFDNAIIKQFRIFFVFVFCSESCYLKLLLLCDIRYVIVYSSIWYVLQSALTSESGHSYE